MRFLYNYLIKIEKELNETFKTERGLELYAHKDFSKERLANRYAEIVSAPIKFDEQVLEKGTNVFIDPVYYHSLYENNRVEYTPNTIDREKGLYTIEPQNIILYENDKGEWKGYMNNFLAEFEMVETKEEKTSSGLIIKEATKERKKGVCKVVYINDFLSENGIQAGDEIQVKPNMGVTVWIEGKQFTWLRDSEVLCKVEK